jgi:hypothetical protein
MQVLEKVRVREVLDGLRNEVLEGRRNRRDLSTEATALETYRFWHLPYGEVPYYNQLVFKRHQPIPTENGSSWYAQQGAYRFSVGSLAGIPTRES